jgi:hypothetical protein
VHDAIMNQDQWSVNPKAWNSISSGLSLKS